MRYIIGFIGFICGLLTNIQSHAQCPLAEQIPFAARQLWSSVLEQGHSQYIVARSDQALRVYESVRSTGLNLVQKFSVPVPSAYETSVAFSQGDLVLSLWQKISAQGDNVSPAPLTEILYYRLSDGQLNTARSQSLTLSSLLPPPQTIAPFYISNWSLSSWQQPICNGSPFTNAQHGRVVGAANDRIFIGHPGEQENYCNPNPDYYRYHLLPNGQPELQIARVSTNSLGQPVGLPICDLQLGFPQVSQCVGTVQDTCQALNSNGNSISVPGACTLRLEPRPVLAFEHCPTCPFWWSLLDPGSLVYQSSIAGAAPLLARASFPANPIPGDPLDPSSIGIPDQHIKIGAITAIRGDPYGSGYAMVAEVGSPNLNFPNFGGIFFYDANGNYRGFGSTLMPNSFTGEGGSLAPIGRDESGKSIYAVGSPRNQNWNLPPNSPGSLKPAAGHVSYYNADGDRIDTEFGSNADDRFGTAIAALGDINSDGTSDMLIGAPGGNYVSITSNIPTFPDGPTGAMYFFSGLLNTEFGQQVASASTTGQTRADVAVVASNLTLYVYDLGTCATSLTTSIAGRQDLKDLLPPLLSAAKGIVPDHKGKIPKIKNPLNPIHPHISNFSKNMPNFLSVLTSNSAILPSNEAIRAEDLSRATSQLNINMNIRDIARAKIVSLSKLLKVEDKACKKFKNANPNKPPKSNKHCKKAKQLKTDIAKNQTAKATAIGFIQFAKDVAVTNLQEISNELP
jgi:hypothetical protein